MDCRHSINSALLTSGTGESCMANLSRLSHLSPCQHCGLGHGMELGRAEAVWKGGCCVLAVTSEQSQSGKASATSPGLQTLVIRDV